MFREFTTSLATGNTRNTFNDKNKFELVTSLIGSSERIKRSAFSNNYHSELRCKRVWNISLVFMFIINISLWVYFCYIAFYQDSVFKLGHMLSFLLTILNLAAYFVKTCIYDRGSNPEERTIVVYWMCCMRLGRFKDLKAFEKPK